MQDPTRPVTRVRRPTLSAPTPAPSAPAEPTLQEQADADQAAYYDEEQKRIARDVELAASAGEELEDVPVAAPPARSEIRREGHARPLTPGFVPRAGDVLVVKYGEVTLPLPKQFAMMRFGDYSYTSQLEDGEDVDTRARAISEWLAKRAEADGVAKYARLAAEIKKADR